MVIICGRLHGYNSISHSICSSYNVPLAYLFFQGRVFASYLWNWADLVTVLIRIWYHWYYVIVKLSHKRGVNFCFPYWDTHSWSLQPPGQSNCPKVAMFWGSPTAHMEKCQDYLEKESYPASPRCFNSSHCLTATAWETQNQKHSVESFPCFWSTATMRDHKAVILVLCHEVFC